MFLHGGWLHLGGNMLYLWIFGDNVEDGSATGKFLIFYLACGVAAPSPQVSISHGSDPNVGASGAIAGARWLPAALSAEPRARADAEGGIASVPAIVVLGFWIVIQLFSQIGSIAQTSGRRRRRVHGSIGGFVAGLLMTLLFRGSGGNPRISV